MSITKQLYVRFGAVLVIVVLLLCVILAAVYRERSTKASAALATEMSQTTDKIRFQMMQNWLYLSNYLLSGDTREVDHMNDGIHVLTEEVSKGQKLATSDQQRSALDNFAKTEAAWTTEFAQPMLQKRKEVDAGNATVADLQIFYLQKDPASWLKNSVDSLNIADAETHHILDERRKADEGAGTWTIFIALLSTLIAVALGVAIAYRTAHSITSPLSAMIKVAKQIGETGDLEHQIEFNRTDEIGQLGRTFSSMVTYLKEMASVSEAIAGGNLAVNVKPRSANDTLC